MHVEIIGHVTHDRFGDTVLPGGCAYYGAGVYATLGNTVSLVTAWGDDFLFAEKAHGIASVQNSLCESTTVFGNHFRADGTRTQMMFAQARPLSPRPFDSKAELVHLAPVLDELDLETWVRRMETSVARRAKIALSVQGFTREKIATPKGWRIEHRTWNPEPNLLEKIDLVFLSEEDLTQQGELLSLLRARIRVVCLTRGGRGATIFSHRDGELSVPTTPIAAVDPTGAGDTFAAAFSSAFVAGAPAGMAAEYANAAAAIIVKGRGPSNFQRLKGHAFSR